MIQTIKCKCGAVFAASHEPHCYTDKVWLKNLKGYVEKRGCTVEMVHSGGNFKFSECTCNDKPKPKNKTRLIQLELFKDGDI